MTSHAHYVRNETLISIAINTALSVAFVYFVFHGQTRIPLLGPHGVVVDMAPQTFMVTLMACLVPGLLTRKRLHAGAMPWVPRSVQISAGRVVGTAIFSAMTVTAVVVGLCWVLLPHLFSNGVAFAPLLLTKAVYGASLAAVVTPWAITRFTRSIAGA